MAGQRDNLVRVLTRRQELTPLSVSDASPPAIAPAVRASVHCTKLINLGTNPGQLRSIICAFAGEIDCTPPRSFACTGALRAPHLMQAQVGQSPGRALRLRRCISRAAGEQSEPLLHLVSGGRHLPP